MQRLRHVVLMKWKRELSAVELDEVTRAMDHLLAEADSVRGGSHGPDARAGDDRADYAVIVDFDDVEGWRAYSAHPAHDPVRSLLKEHMADSFKVQFWVSESSRHGPDEA